MKSFTALLPRPEGSVCYVVRLEASTTLDCLSFTDYSFGYFKVIAFLTHTRKKMTNVLSLYIKRGALIGLKAGQLHTFTS